MYLGYNGWKIEVGWSEPQNSQDENYNGPGRLEEEEEKKEAQAEMRGKSAQGKRDEPA